MSGEYWYARPAFIYLSILVAQKNWSTDLALNHVRKQLPDQFHGTRLQGLRMFWSGREMTNLYFIQFMGGIYENKAGRAKFVCWLPRWEQREFYLNVLTNYVLLRECISDLSADGDLVLGAHATFLVRFMPCQKEKGPCLLYRNSHDKINGTGKNA